MWAENNRIRSVLDFWVVLFTEKNRNNNKQWQQARGSPSRTVNFCVEKLSRLQDFVRAARKSEKNKHFLSDTMVRLIMLTSYEKIPNEMYVFNKSKNTVVKRPVHLAVFKMEKHSYKTKETSSANVNQHLFHFLGGKNHRHKLISCTIVSSWDKNPHNTVDKRTLGFTHVSIILLQKELSRKPAMLWSTLLRQMPSRMFFPCFVLRGIVMCKRKAR